MQRKSRNTFEVKKTDWVKAYSELSDATNNMFSPAKYRELIRARDRNGLEEHCRVVGRDVMISVSGFWTWMDVAHNGKKRRHHGGRPSKYS
tara:strand:- start:2809 stop:3081 length:273 start_codon:yes stop_codon:yes gene_type:complete